MEAVEGEEQELCKWKHKQPFQETLEEHLMFDVYIM